MRKTLTGLSILFSAYPIFAATPVDLSKESSAFLTSRALTSTVTMNETRRTVDFNQTLHVRVQETYLGYPVWGADAVVHTSHINDAKKALLSTLKPSSSMNGIFYRDLEQDLANTPQSIFSPTQKEKSIAHVISLYQTKTKVTAAIKDQQSQLMVYVDKNNKAHWAFRVSFFVPSAVAVLPKKPVYIVDAINFNIYQEWDSLNTLEKISGGGYGGNHKTGQQIFDGLTGHNAYLDMQRDANKNTCYLQNDQAIVKDARYHLQIANFPCQKQDPQHGDIYWDDHFDMIETTWSPSNDVLFGAKIGYDMFKEWYGIPMLTKNGKPLILPIIVHETMENAYWENNKVIFGDSIHSDMFNPFTSLDTVVHEMGHGFTEKNSGLEYYSQSGGLNEAFSDMAGIAAEFFAYGKTDFLVGYGDVKAAGKALRYMDQPSKDCEANRPGWSCSIDDMSQYREGMDVHYTSGIFNRAYYLLANAAGWNPKKAFDVMVQANINYWTSTTSFAEAACGVIKAAKDYQYDLSSPAQAFKAVGIDTKNCLKQVST